MYNIFIIASVISITFFLIKFFEMRFLEKESKPLKILLKDSILVYFSVIISIFFVQQFQPLTINGVKTPIFTDNPGF